MKIAILHYHFDRGGVTSVVRSTLKSLKTQSEVEFVLLSGRPVEDMDAPSAVIPELDYDQNIDTGTLYEKVLTSARQLLHSELPDVWHIHNPTLGKNGAMVGLVAELARNGHPLLLHQHDFAEDFRPANFELREKNRNGRDPVFPYASHIRFATINRRDSQILQKAGMPASYALVLPNPVDCPEEIGGHDGSDNSLLLYPVRGLPRKNFGELLYLATLLKDRYEFATTLPPTNKKNIAHFKHWENLSKELNLPVRLAVARDKKEKLDTWVEQSTGIISTSVAEGFGLCFLESWMKNRPICGRDLPEVTSEFKENGILLDNLYRELNVSTDLFSLDDVKKKLKSSILHSYQRFGRKMKEIQIDDWLATLGANGFLDFSFLHTEQQTEMLRQLTRSKQIDVSIDLKLDSARKNLKINQSVIRKKYSMSAYARRLLSIYQEISGSSASKINAADPDVVLRSFLDVRRFRPLFQ